MSGMKTLVAAAALLAITGGAQAALEDRGNGMIYDTTRNITWLADMNYAKTSGYDADGLMTWSAAKTWADNLTFGGYSDWRLPTLNPADTTCDRNFNPGGGFPNQYYGFNCTGGQLSGLFVTDLGNKGGESVLTAVGDTDTQIANLALFRNVQSWGYWSGTAYDPTAFYRWRFTTLDGSQIYGGESNTLYAVALRSGDVVAAIPEPQTYAMMLLGISAVMVAVRRRSR